MDRLWFAIVGAILGALVTASILWWFMDSINLQYIVAGSVGCAILAAFIGEQFIALLKEIWWWS